MNRQPSAQIDDIAYRIELSAPDEKGFKFAVRTQSRLCAFDTPWLPRYLPSVATNQPSEVNQCLVIACFGKATTPFTARLLIDHHPRGEHVPVEIEREKSFCLEIRVPLSDLPLTDTALSVELQGLPGLPTVQLPTLSLLAVRSPLPAFSSTPDEFLSDITYQELFGDERRPYNELCDIQQGFWVGTGIWTIEMSAVWAESEESTPSGDAATQYRAVINDRPEVDCVPKGLFQIEPKTASKGSCAAYLLFDTEASRFPPVQAQGLPVEFTLIGRHDLRLEPPRPGAQKPVTIEWQLDRRFNLRQPPLAAKRRGAVAIDFGTTSTVACYSDSNNRETFARLGSPPGEHDMGTLQENPTLLLVENHEALWAAMADGRRFPNLRGVASGSHKAKRESERSPASVISQIKSLPWRLPSHGRPQSIYQEKGDGRAFVLDAERVYACIQAYAYLVGRALNRPNGEVWTDYVITYPANLEDDVRQQIEKTFKSGIIKSIPQSIDTTKIKVEFKYTEPVAYAAGVLQSIIVEEAVRKKLCNKNDAIRFAVFDFGGGTLDIACGTFRDPTPEERRAVGAEAVIDIHLVTGDNSLGGDCLSEELTWQATQTEDVRAKLHAHNVPVQLPATEADNPLAPREDLRRPGTHARKNRAAIFRHLRVEQFKRKRSQSLSLGDASDLKKHIVDLDGNAVGQALAEEISHSFHLDSASIRTKMADHMKMRVKAGVQQLIGAIRSAPWGGEVEDHADHGEFCRRNQICVLLAGNSSKSEYVAEAFAEVLKPSEPTASSPVAEKSAIWSGEGGNPPEAPIVIRYDCVDRGGRHITPKTAVAIGGLRLASNMVHQNAVTTFRYFVGMLRGMAGVFEPEIRMGAPLRTQQSIIPWRPGQPIFVAKADRHPKDGRKLQRGDTELRAVPLECFEEAGVQSSCELVIDALAPDELGVAVRSLDPQGNANGGWHTTSIKLDPYFI